MFFDRIFSSFKLPATTSFNKPLRCLPRAHTQSPPAAPVGVQLCGIRERIQEFAAVEKWSPRTGVFVCCLARSDPCGSPMRRWVLRQHNLIDKRSLSAKWIISNIDSILANHNGPPLALISVAKHFFGKFLNLIVFSVRSQPFIVLADRRSSVWQSRRCCDGFITSH